MATPGLDLDTYGRELQSAVASSSPQTLPYEIREWFLNWVKGSIFTLLWSFLIFSVFLFVFYGAFQYFTAYGDENKAEQGKKTLTYAFVGLVIGAVAMGIAAFVNNILISKDANVKIENFQAPTTPPSSGSGSGTGSSSITP